MSCGNGIGKLAVGLCAVGWLSGCVSLDDYRRLQAAHRNVTAQKEGLHTELTSARSAIDALRMQSDRCNEELRIKDQLVNSLHDENDLLDSSRVKAISELERLQGQPMGDVIITQPKLPAPLDNALKQFAQAHPTSVEYDSTRGTVKWKADLLFALGSDVVKESSLAPLQAFTKVLNSPEARGFEVIVVGHTDNQPIKKEATRAKHPTNWHLSSHRAIAVASSLQRYSYTPQKIGVMGYGQFRPVSDNASQEGRSRNRRVDIYLVPAGSIAGTASAAPIGSRSMSPVADDFTK
ncbi:MAG: OmpA/MotB family protein [Planctomycetota bacterium]|jgi:chemotaxis protein MotB